MVLFCRLRLHLQFVGCFIWTFERHNAQIFALSSAGRRSSGDSEKLCLVDVLQIASSKVFGKVDMTASRSNAPKMECWILRVFERCLSAQERFVFAISGQDNSESQRTEG
jgi:hypothetical protein